MTVKGRVRNGAIVLDEPIVLAEGTEVNVDLGDAVAARETNGDDVPDLYDQFYEFIGTVADLPSDFAERHDHYIHGAGK